jgi:hypothetical protein
MFYLSEAPSPPMASHSHPYTHTCVHCTVYSILYLRTQGRGRELTREKVRGAIVHKAGRKYQHDLLYLQSINSSKDDI